MVKKNATVNSGLVENFDHYGGTWTVFFHNQQTQTYPTLLISEEGENEVAKPSFLCEFDSTEEEGMVAHR